MALTKIQTEQIADDAVGSAHIADNIALGGSPTTTTQSASDNSTKVATTAYVDTAYANLVDSSPATLNTLNELAAALGDDANFSTTVTNSIATKLPLAGGTMTGTIAGFTSTGIDDNADATAITIDSSEKVIIGDTSSHTDDLLQIESPASGGGHGIQIRRNDSNTDQGIGRILFGNNTDTDLATVSAKTDGANDSAALLFSTQTTGGASAERMRIDSSGNVGIGEASPDAPLHITSNTPIIVFDESDASQEWRLGSFGGTFALYDSTDSAYRLAVDGDGKVGIGTTSPAGMLHVDGHTSSIASIFESNGNGDTVPVQLKVKANNGTTSTQGLYGNAGSASTDNTITLGTSGTNGLTIDNLGNLSSSSTGGHVQIDNGIGVTTRETMTATGHAWQSNTYNVLSAGSTSIGTDSTGTTHMWFNSYDTGSKYSVKAGHSADLYHGITDGQFVLRMSSNATSSNGEGITMLQRLYIDKDGTFQLHSAGTNDTTIKFYKGASTIKWWMQNDTSGSPGSDAFWIGDEENDNGVYVVQDGSSWQGISDERLKRNWTNLENATDKIKTLTKVGTFQRRGKTTGNWSDNREVGLSAQEVEAILPEAVTTGGDIEFASDDKVTGVKGMAYEKLVPLLVKSIQELEARIKTLEG